VKASSTSSVRSWSSFFKRVLCFALAIWKFTNLVHGYQLSVHGSPLPAHGSW
jgi:hypothetical protein